MKDFAFVTLFTFHTNKHGVVCSDVNNGVGKSCAWVARQLPAGRGHSAGAGHSTLLGRRAARLHSGSSLLPHFYFSKVFQQLSSQTWASSVTESEAFWRKLALSAVGRGWSACCTYTGYNEYSDEARYGVMRSAKRTQTYWRAGCIGAAAGGGGRRGRAIGPPGHASDVAGDAVAAAAASPQHGRRPASRRPDPTLPIHFAPLQLS